MAPCALRFGHCGGHPRMLPAAELTATCSPGVVAQGSPAADEACEPCRLRTRSAGAGAGWRPRRGQSCRDEESTRRPRRSALSHWVFWPTLDQQLGVGDSPRSAASGRKPETSANSTGIRKDVPLLASPVDPEPPGAGKCTEETSGEVIASEPACDMQSGTDSAQQTIEPRTLGHSDQCVLRPVQCQYCGQRLAAAVLAPHEEVCGRRHRTQRQLPHQARVAVQAAERPQSAPEGLREQTCEEASGRGEGAPLRPAGELPPLSRRVRPPARPAPAPPKTTPRERPGVRPALPEPALTQDPWQQAAPAASADASAGASESPRGVPSLEELRQQVQRERDAYIQLHLADRAACH